MKLKNELKKALLAWDGKSTEYVSNIYTLNSTNNNFVDSLIELTKEPTCEKGATWLLKAWSDQKQAFSTKHVSALLSQLEHFHFWESQLHVLQCLDNFSIAKKYKPSLELFLRKTLNHQNKFLRTWAYNGFHVLATQYPEYRQEVTQFFNMALRDESAAVKARIRNLLKTGF